MTFTKAWCWSVFSWQNKTLATEPSPSLSLRQIGHLIYRMRGETPTTFGLNYGVGSIGSFNHDMNVKVLIEKLS